MTSSAYFITGTDTEIGKTLAACALIHVLRQRGLKVAAMKPVAAGHGPDGQNDDLRQLRAASNVPVAPDLMCPYLFREAIAPHLASYREQKPIHMDRLIAAYRELSRQADCVVIEGAGGLRVPLGTDPFRDMADFIQAIHSPVILVVGMKLGCINHALLTMEGLRQRGIPVTGWIANQIDPAMSCISENLQTLKACLGAPFLGHIPHLDNGEDALAASSHLDF